MKTLKIHKSSYDLAVGKSAACFLALVSIVSFVSPVARADTTSVPVVATVAATNVQANSATVAGTVNPGGLSTNYWFEYGTTVSLGGQTPSQSAGNSSSTISFSGSLAGLNSNTTYYYRFAAQNSLGASYGSVLSFTTSGSSSGTSGSLPTVTTLSNSGSYYGSATLQGSVNPNGAATTAWFEYGPTPSMGYTVGNQSVGSGTTANTISSAVNNLISGTTYYYRLVAMNSYGTVQGQTLSFTSLGTTYGTGYNPYCPTGTYCGYQYPYGSGTGYYPYYGTGYNPYYPYGSGTGYNPYYPYGSGTGYNPYYGTGSGTGYYPYYGTGYNPYGSGSGYNPYCPTGTYCGQGSQPLVQTYQATGIADTSANFTGQVTPNGADTIAWFEFGTTSGNSFQYNTASQSVGSANYPQTLNQIASSLAPGTTYYYRAAARNASGTQYGQTLSFTTTGGGYSNYNNNPVTPSSSQPSVTTQAAQYVYSTAAMLTANLNANNSPTTSWFEYGTSANLGQRTDEQPVGSGSTPGSIFTAVTNLASGTTYYYRAAARNQYGTVQGGVMSLRTPSAAIAYAASNNSYITNNNSQNYVAPTRSNSNSGYVYTKPSAPSAPSAADNTPNNNSASVTGNNANSANPSTASSGPSCLALLPSIDRNPLSAGDKFNFILSFRNNCSYPIKNAQVRINLPSGSTLLNSNIASAVAAPDYLANLGTVSAGSEAPVNLQGQAGPAGLNGTYLFGALAEYLDNQNHLTSVSTFLPVSQSSASVPVGQSPVVGTTTAVKPVASAASGQPLTKQAAGIFTVIKNAFSNWLFLVILIAAFLFLLYWFFLRERNDDGTEDLPLALTLKDPHEQGSNDTRTIRLES